MSIRHYNPRRRQRRGISDRSRLFLYFVLAIALLLQVSYPLLDGESLRVVTIATVYWGAAAMALAISDLVLSGCITESTTPISIAF